MNETNQEADTLDGKPPINPAKKNDNINRCLLVMILACHVFSVYVNLMNYGNTSTAVDNGDTLQITVEDLIPYEDPSRKYASSEVIIK